MTGKGVVGEIDAERGSCDDPKNWLPESTCTDLELAFLESA